MKKEEHFGNCPKNIEHFINILDQKIAELEQNNHTFESSLILKKNEINEMNEKIEHLTNKLKEVEQKVLNIKHRAQGLVSTKQYQMFQYIQKSNPQEFNWIEQQLRSIGEITAGKGDMDSIREQYFQFHTGQINQMMQIVNECYSI